MRSCGSMGRQALARCADNVAHEALPVAVERSAGTLNASATGLQGANTQFILQSRGLSRAVPMSEWSSIVHDQNLTC